MQQNTNQPEANVEAKEQALDAALEKVGIDPERKAVQDAAAAEERQAAELIKRSREEQGEVAAQPEPEHEEEPLVSILSKGQDYLHQAMREHMAREDTKRNAYKPPPMTERQLSALEEEQAAGRRARARHEAELASRPPPPRDPSEGSTTPVHRPGTAVPDPTVASPTGYIAGRGQFDQDDRNAVMIPGQ